MISNFFKRSLPFVLTLCFGIIACEPGDKPEPPSDKLTGWTTYVKIERFGNTLPSEPPLTQDTIFSEVKYDENGRINRINDKYGLLGYHWASSELFYEGNRLTSWVRNSKSSTNQGNRYTLEYQDGKPTRLLTSFGGQPALTFDSMVYDAQGRLMYYHKHRVSSFITINAFKLNWENDNITSVETLYGDDRQIDPVTGKIALRRSNFYTYTYGNQPNVRLPMQGSGEGEKVFYIGDDWHLLSKQRTLKRESLSADRQTGKIKEFRFKTTPDNRLLEMESIETTLLYGTVEMKWQSRSAYNYK